MSDLNYQCNQPEEHCCWPVLRPPIVHHQFSKRFSNSLKSKKTFWGIQVSHFFPKPTSPVPGKRIYKNFKKCACVRVCECVWVCVWVCVRVKKRKMNQRKRQCLIFHQVRNVCEPIPPRKPSSPYKSSFHQFHFLLLLPFSLSLSLSFFTKDWYVLKQLSTLRGMKPGLVVVGCQRGHPDAVEVPGWHTHKRTHHVQAPFFYKSNSKVFEHNKFRFFEWPYSSPGMQTK